MDYSDELIQNIRELAEALTPVSDIAALLDVDESLLRDELSNKLSPVRKAYDKGVQRAC